MWDLPILLNDPLVVEFTVYAKSEVYLALSDKEGPDLDGATVYYIGRYLFSVPDCNLRRKL